jgi:hypothetical protein
MLATETSSSNSIASIAAPVASRLGRPSTFFYLVLEQRLKAITDVGRDIPLFRFDVLVLPPQPGQRAFDPSADRCDFLKSVEQEFVANICLDRAKLVRVADPQPACNCHGWIFTGGQFGIQDPHIPLILDENGYVPVEDAKHGDLAIYRIDGGIVHSGIVRRTDPGGAILIESKWGAFGVFSHAPDAYPGICTFYRSSRTGHRMALGRIFPMTGKGSP